MNLELYLNTVFDFRLLYLFLKTVFCSSLVRVQVWVHPLHAAVGIDMRIESHHLALSPPLVFSVTSCLLPQDGSSRDVILCKCKRHYFPPPPLPFPFSSPRWWNMSAERVVVDELKTDRRLDPSLRKSCCLSYFYEPFFLGTLRVTTTRGGWRKAEKRADSTAAVKSSTIVREKWLWISFHSASLLRVVLLYSVFAADKKRVTFAISNLHRCTRLSERK